MPRQRLLNCDFLLDSKFLVELSNKAKLLYVLMFASADDKGFVGTTKELIKSLEENDSNYVGDTIDLVKYTYDDALYELINRGYLYEFKNKYDSATHLIRHWYYHNKFYSKAWTNYKQYLKLVKLVENEYVYKSKSELEKIKNEQEQKEIEQVESGKTRQELLDELEESKEQDSDSWDKMIEDLEQYNKNESE